MHDTPTRDRREWPDSYTIHIGAPLGDEWAEWLTDAKVMALDDGSGLIMANVRDQAMLFGLLLRIRDLGIRLLGLYPGHRMPAEM